MRDESCPFRQNFAQCINHHHAPPLEPHSDQTQRVQTCSSRRLPGIQAARYKLCASWEQRPSWRCGKWRHHGQSLRPAPRIAGNDHVEPRARKGEAECKSHSGDPACVGGKRALTRAATVTLLPVAAKFKGTCWSTCEGGIPIVPYQRPKCL